MRGTAPRQHVALLQYCFNVQFTATCHVLIVDTLLSPAPSHTAPAPSPPPSKKSKPLPAADRHKSVVDLLVRTLKESATNEQKLHILQLMLTRTSSQLKQHQQHDDASVGHVVDSHPHMQGWSESHCW